MSEEPENHQKAITALMEMADTGKLVEVLILGGLQQRLRDRAEQVVTEAE